MRKIILSLIFMLIAGAAHANPDQLYRDGKYAEARDAYAELSIENPKEVRYRFNQGCAAYKAGDNEGAVLAFQSTIRRTTDDDMKFDSYYNLGNIHLQMQDYKSAVGYYTAALRINNKDKALKNNFELALRLLKEQEEQEQQSSGDQEGEDQQQDQEQSGNQDQSDLPGQDRESGQKNGEQQDGQQEEPQQQTEGGQPRQPEQQEAAFDQQQAEALLDNMEEDRQQFMRYNIPSDKGVGSGKAW